MRNTLIVAGLAVLASGAFAAQSEVLPFVADDYSRALAQAKSKKLPLFVEAWAPW